MITKQPLPKGWRWAKLGDVCEFLDSKRVPINNYERNKRIDGKSQDQLFPYYGANGQVGWIDDYIFDESLILLAEDGGNFGSPDKPIAYAVSGKYWVNNHAHVLKPREELIDFQFCLHSLRIRPDLGDLVSGSTRPKLNQEIASSIQIPLPPMEEQKRIAARLDEQMRHIEQARLAAEESLSAAWELPSAYLGEVFEGKEAKKWGIQKLGGVSKIVGGVQKTPDRAPTNFHKPYLTVRNVQKGYLDLSQVERFEVTPNEFERCKLKQGDILIVEGNGSIDHIGRNALFELPEDDWIHQNHIIRVRLDSSFNPKFVSLFLNSPLGRSQMIEKAETTSGLYTLSSGKVASLEIPTPSLDEQQKIVDGLNKKLAVTNEMQTSLESQLAEIESLPSAVLGQAFEGRL